MPERAPLQVTISQNAAQQLSLAPGGTLRLRSSAGAEPIQLSIVSTYVVRDPAGTYWSNPLFQANGGLDPAFTPIGTFKLRQLWEPTVSYDVQVPDELIRGDGGYALGPVIELLRSEAVRGAAVVFATHDPEAAAACDRELHLADGDALWARP